MKSYKIALKNIVREGRVVGDRYIIVPINSEGCDMTPLALEFKFNERDKAVAEIARFKEAIATVILD